MVRSQKGMYVPDIIYNNPTSREILDYKYENFVLIEDVREIEDNHEKLFDIAKIMQIDDQVKNLFPEKYHEHLKVTNQNKDMIKDVFDIEINELDKLIATVGNNNISVFLIYILSHIIKKTYFENPDVFFVDFSHGIDRIHKKRECELNFEIGMYRNFNFPLQNLIAIQNHKFIKDIRLKRKKITYNELKEILEVIEYQIEFISGLSTKLEIKKNNYNSRFLNDRRKLIYSHGKNADTEIELIKSRIEIMNDTIKIINKMYTDLIEFKELVEDMMDGKFHYSKIPDKLIKYINKKFNPFSFT